MELSGIEMRLAAMEGEEIEWATARCPNAMEEAEVIVTAKGKPALLMRCSKAPRAGEAIVLFGEEVVVDGVGAPFVRGKKPHQYVYFTPRPEREPVKQAEYVDDDVQNFLESEDTLYRNERD